MEGQLNLDCERFQQITQMAKMGWWESDVKNQQYICSDFIVDLLSDQLSRVSSQDTRRSPHASQKRIYLSFKS